MTFDHDRQAKIAKRLAEGRLSAVRYYPPTLSKNSQRKIIEAALRMLEHQCPDWNVYAEPKKGRAAS